MPRLPDFGEVAGWKWRLVCVGGHIMHPAAHPPRTPRRARLNHAMGQPPPGLLQVAPKRRPRQSAGALTTRRPSVAKACEHCPGAQGFPACYHRARSAAAWAARPGCALRGYVSPSTLRHIRAPTADFGESGIRQGPAKVITKVENAVYPRSGGRKFPPAKVAKV